MPDTIDQLIQASFAMLSSGNHEEADSLLSKVLEISPDNPGTLRAISEGFFVQGDFDRAKQFCDRAIAIDGEFERAHFLLGVIAARRGDLDDSISALERAVAIRPDYLDAVRALAAVSAQSRNYPRALECFRQLVAGGVDSDEVLLEFAETAEHGDSLEEAVEVRREILRRHPDDENNRFNLASLDGGNPPAIAPREMTTRTFDDYVDRFESHLDHLGYRGPALLFEAVGRHHHRDALRILDLGCGTGLSGEPFREIASCLIGVDLSAKMLDKAREKQLYDELHCGDLIEFFERPYEFDLMIAADTMIYIGDLEPVFTAARQRMAPDGLFTMTIESGACDGFAVNRSHRYVHSPAYLRRVAKRTRWKVAGLSECVIRQEFGRDIDGFVVVLEAN